MNAATELSPQELLLPPLTEFLAGALRTLYLGYMHSPEGIPRSKEELVQGLAPHLQDEKLATLISSLEATQTFRHVYVYALAERVDAKELQTAIEALEKAAPFCAIEKLHYLGSNRNDYPLLRLAHPVTSSYLVPDGAGRMKIETSSVRHAVVIAIKPELGIVEIRFNGYEQAKYTTEINRISYRDIADQCKAFLNIYLGIKVRGLPLKLAVDELLSKYPDEVAQKNNVSLIENLGRISLDVFDGQVIADINELLKKAKLSRQGDSNDKVATTGWSAERIILEWPKFSALTRIDFTGETPEVMFSWRASEHRALRSHDIIIKRLMTYTDLNHSEINRKLESALFGLNPADIVTVVDISQRANTSAQEALAFVMQMVEAKRLQMLFRVKTSSHLLDAENSWVMSLAALPREVETMDGSKLDLFDPRNVEVGFSMAGAH